MLAWLLGSNVALAGATGFAVSPGVLVASFVLNAASLVVAALAGTRLAGEPPAARLRTGPGRLPWRGVALGVALLLALSQALDSLLTLLRLREGGALGLLDEAVARMTGLLAVLMLIGAGLLAPVAEELFFRGFVQTRLRARWRRWPAIAVTAAAFGVLHLDPVHAAFAFVIGLFLGWLAELAGSIRPAVGAHVANNVLSLAQARLLPAAAPDPVQAGLLVVLLAAVAALSVALRRVAASPPA